MMNEDGTYTVKTINTGFVIALCIIIFMTSFVILIQECTPGTTDYECIHTIEE